MKGRISSVVGASALLCTICTILLTIPSSFTPSLSARHRDDDKAIVHVLNRMAFGPKPGDVERVRSIGVDRFIDEQLHPERIRDAEVSSHLTGLESVTMSSRAIAQSYELPQIEAKKEVRQEAKQAAATSADAALKPDPAQKRANEVVVELSEQKILRAIYSERQLQEVLTDFWFNHFNVDARKGPDRFMLTEYERETIRPRVLGKFRDLLGATAKSPAMLFYLDNWLSVDPNRPRPPQNPNAPKGLNENYGRELMELHTLGVDGGYSQKDVTEVARAFTGWTIDRPRQGGGFTFNPRVHDPGQKIVLGHIIKAGGGESDGEQVLDILATHPSTARFIATKLVRRFVSDAPPQSLVDRAATRFRETDGDLREVLRTILTSPEFMSADAYRAKVKTPFEFVVSSVRAMGADVQDAVVLVRTLQQLGMPLYMCQPPTGYKDTADGWVNTGALVNRMNFALRLSSGQLPGVMVGDLESSTLLSDPSGNEGPDRVIVSTLLGNDASDSTRATIARAGRAPQMAALTLGAPEFQRK
ncbi:MAG TPA: DUF1800 domain-containing protein [Vicinamibacterales bacterium]|jgi:uncharacterized protein (DUF1800 family)|nr:DUF1800 domain-containing protein [Vicinamibacterales bacterium]